MKHYTYLIVGGGMTADAAVKGIRGVDTKGNIGIVSMENDPPYFRPPLSKGLWTGDSKVEDIDCDTAAKDAEIVVGRQIVSFDPGKRIATDHEGGTYGYDRLLLATGGAPRRLPLDATGVIYYRTLADYKQLRELTKSAKRFAILGGGFIGSEIAAALKQNGQQVTMVFPETGIGGRILPPDFSKVLTRYYLDHDIKVVPELKPSGLHQKDGEFTVHLENGHAFPVDGVVAGIGIIPNTQLAAEAGLEVDNGIVVDDQLRTKAPNVFAAGDVANFYNPALDERLRVEHEDNALTMGETAGRNMAGEEQPYHHLPFFYSDLFDAGYEAVGKIDSSLNMVANLTDPQGKGCIFYLESERVRGVIFWNVFGKVDAGRDFPSTHACGSSTEGDEPS